MAEQFAQTPVQHDDEDDEYVPLANAAGGAVPYTPGEMSEISDLDFSPVPPVGRKKGGGVQQSQPNNYPQPPPPQQYNPYAYMHQGSLSYSMASQGGGAPPPPGWNDSGYGSYYFHQPPPPPMMMYPQGTDFSSAANNSKASENGIPNIDHLLGKEEYSVYTQFITPVGLCSFTCPC
jgi:hypothetical protein